MTQQQTQNTCGHGLTRETVHSGSMRDGAWVLDPYACANCNKEMCDECCEDCKSCSHCSEFICPDCAPIARQRKSWYRSGERTEYLCSVCCARQDAARATLERFLYRSARAEADRLLNALIGIETEAKKAVEDATEMYWGKYPEQSGFLSANLKTIAINANVEHKYSTAIATTSLEAISDKDSWLDEIVSELEEAIRTAKRDADL